MAMTTPEQIAARIEHLRNRHLVDLEYNLRIDLEARRKLKDRIKDLEETYALWVANAQRKG